MFSVFLVVVVVWVFSVCLHEFGHAWTAWKGGDYTVVEKGYLTMNPLKYTHPVMSILMPLLFMAMGGIGLPGGAVYINRHLLRSPAWETRVALAGPLMNLALAGIIALLLRLVLIPHFPVGSITCAFAFLLQLQISAVLFNLLPVPPLDGFHAIEPWLPLEWKEIIAPIASYGMFALFILFWYVPPANHALWSTIFYFSDLVGVDHNFGIVGLELFRFWER